MEGTSTDVPICGHVRAFGSDASRPKRSEGPRLRRARSRLAVVADPHAFVLLSLTVLEVAGGHSGAVDERPARQIAESSGRGGPFPPAFRSNSAAGRADSQPTSPNMALMLSRSVAMAFVWT